MAAKKAATGAALAKGEQDQGAALAELGDFFDSVAVDGMDDIEGEDITLPVKIFNMGGLKPDKSPRMRNVFFDSISENEQNELDCVLLLTNKSNRWTEYNNATEKTDLYCASDDRLSGVRRLPLEQEGDVRQCDGCPDKQWTTNAEGKSEKRCGEVHTVIAFEKDTGRPFLIRFKKTSLKPFRSYVMAHHWNGRRDKAGNTKNVPLFAYECKLTLAMHESGNYALPVFEKGAMLDLETMKKMHDIAKDYHEIMGRVIEHADKVETKHGGTERDSSMSSDDFADDDDAG